MSMADAIISVANLLYAAALFVRDVLWLRLLILVSGAILLVWGLVKAEWVFVGWSVLFFLINGGNIVRLLLERRNVELSAELAAIHQAVFGDLGKREFLNFWNFGAERRLAAGEIICVEGEPPLDLMILLSGAALVSKDGVEIVRLGPLAFIGEMSYLTGRPASADVSAATETRLMAWSQTKLRDLGRLDPPLLARLHTILGRDLSAKLAKN